MENIDRILRSDELVKLVQGNNFVGWIYRIDYDTAWLMTNDLWKVGVLGIPHNAFLVAASFDPDQFAAVPPEEREVILLRVVGTARLPQDDDLVRAKVDHYQQQRGAYEGTGASDYDDITRNQMQFGGLECRVLGTFYVKEGELYYLGSDLESFVTAGRLNVYRPRGQALRMVVNHVDPLRRRRAVEEAQQLGIEDPIRDFRIGTVRYTSTDRLHRRDDTERVPVTIQPSDFLARRTAVLGMTRTGKSNMVKQTVRVVKRVADEGGVKIGQIVYDINGEYANANQQDQGAISDVYPGETVRYRMLETPDFEELQNNFYIQLNEGFSTIRQVVRENNQDSQPDVAAFLDTSFDEPDPSDRSEHNRWRVRVAAYQAMLHRAEFPAPEGHKIYFEANQNVRQAIERQARHAFKNPRDGLPLDEAVEWFVLTPILRVVLRLQSALYRSRSRDQCASFPGDSEMNGAATTSCPAQSDVQSVTHRFVEVVVEVVVYAVDFTQRAVLCAHSRYHMRPSAKLATLPAAKCLPGVVVEPDRLRREYHSKSPGSMARPNTNGAPHVRACA
jgi:Helicase HerA, central domain